MNDQKDQQEVEEISVVLEPRKLPVGEREIRKMKVVVVLDDKVTRTKFFQTEYPCSLDTMLNNVKAVVEAVRAEAE